MKLAFLLAFPGHCAAPPTLETTRLEITVRNTGKRNGITISGEDVKADGSSRSITLTQQTTNFVVSDGTRNCRCGYDSTLPGWKVQTPTWPWCEQALDFATGQQCVLTIKDVKMAKITLHTPYQNLMRCELTFKSYTSASILVFEARPFDLDFFPDETLSCDHLFRKTKCSFKYTGDSVTIAAMPEPKWCKGVITKVDEPKSPTGPWWPVWTLGMVAVFLGVFYLCKSHQRVAEQAKQRRAGDDRVRDLFDSAADDDGTTVRGAVSGFEDTFDDNGDGSDFGDVELPTSSR